LALSPDRHGKETSLSGIIAGSRGRHRQHIGQTGTERSHNSACIPRHRTATDLTEQAGLREIKNRIAAFNPALKPYLEKTDVGL
jgi:hypothetical protein